MVITTAPNQSEESLGLVRRAESLIVAGTRSGNFGLVTSSKVCRAIATMDAAGIHTTLLEEMGIRAEVTEVPGGMMIEVPDHHGLNAIMNAAARSSMGAWGRRGHPGGHRCGPLSDGSELTRALPRLGQEMAPKWFAVRSLEAGDD